MTLHQWRDCDGVAQPTVVKDCDINPSDPTPVEDHDVMHSDGVAEPTAVKDRDVIPSDPTLVEDHDVMHSGVAKHRVVKDSDIVAKPTPVDHDVMHSHVAMKPPAQVEKSDGIPSAESDIEVLCVKKGEEKCVPKDDTETSKSDTMMDSDSYVTALKDNDVENHSDTTETESSSDGSKRNSCYKTKKTEGESNSDVILLNDASDTTEKEGQAEERTESEAEESVKLSPDESSVKISNKKLTVVDKPPRLRSETRGQYMC